MALTSADITEVLNEIGHTEHVIFEPSSETRGRWVVRAFTSQGWKYLRMMAENANLPEVERFAAKYQPYEAAE